MKAKDYYNKYVGYFFLNGVRLFETELAARTVIDDFIAEAKIMAESRKAEGLNSCATIIQEQDLKWRAMCRIFVKKHGFSPLRKDSFWYWMEATMIHNIASLPKH